MKYVTLTLNPVVDYIINLKELKQLNLNPMKDLELIPGGKGINASIVLKEFNIENLAVHYSGGFTGDYIKKSLDSLKLKNEQVESKDVSPINIKLNVGEKMFELDGRPDKLSSKAKEKILNIIIHMKKESYLFMMGYYNDRDFSFIKKILRIAKKQQIRIVLDLPTNNLRELLKFQPFFIKPNKYEVELALGKKIKNQKELIKAARSLKEMGAKNVAISMEDKGSLLLDESDCLYFATIDKINQVSAQGAGDSFIASFIANLENNNYELAFKYANAAGAATASVKGIAKRKEIDKMIKKVNIVKK